jgi:hypothetical protein
MLRTMRSWVLIFSSAPAASETLRCRGNAMHWTTREERREESGLGATPASGNTSDGPGSIARYVFSPGAVTTMARRRNDAARKKDIPADPLERLAGVWRARAAECRSLYADEPRAHMIEAMVTELDLALHELRNAQLTYDEAAIILDCAYGTVKNRVVAGELTNVGSRAEPRVALSQIVSGLRASAAGVAVFRARALQDHGGAR